MKKTLLAILRTLVFVLPLSLCFVSCEGFDLEGILGNIIKPGGGDETEEEYDEAFILSELENMEVGAICTPTYVDGADTYLFTNGLAMSVIRDSLSGYCVLIDSLDLKESVWSESKRVSLYMDSLYRPIVVIGADSKLSFDYNSDDSFSVTSYAADGTSKNIDIAYGQRATTRASAEPSGLGGLCNGLDILGIVQDAFGNNGFGHINALTNLLTKALPEGLPQDFASLAVSGVLLHPAVAEFLVSRFGYVAGGPLGWAALLATSFKTVEDFFAWLVEQKIGDCTPRITSVTLEGENSVDVRVEFVGAGFSSAHEDTPMYYIQYWQEVDGKRVGQNKSTVHKEAKYGFCTEHISGLTGGKYAFQVILYPSSFYTLRNVLNFSSNVMHAEIAPLYLSEVAQKDASYYNRLLTFSMKALTAYQSEGDRVVLSYYDEYGVYVQRDSRAKELYSSKANMGNEYYINLDFKKSDMNIETVEFKATPKESIKFGVYTKDGYGIVKYYDEQVPEISYTDAPKAHTGETVSVEKTEATVECEFEDCLFWTTLRGVEYFTDGTTDVETLDSGKEDGTHGFHLTDLKSNTTYKYRAYYEVNGVKEYGETKSFKTKGSDLCDDANHVHAVDLGLSVKWACCNVGADVPEGYGGYYAWGETEEKSNYTYKTYKYWSDKDGDGNRDNGEFQNIGSNISGTSYDVAHVKWGASWRMPTKAEQDELRTKCSWQWTTVNGVNGMKVTGPSGKSIFLPAAGCRRLTSLYYAGSNGFYWSATLWSDDYYDAHHLDFGSGDCYWYTYYYRNHGFTVRPVSE